MLESHLNAIEDVLIAQSKTAQNAGHPNLRGGPREWFIRDFLIGHLPSTLEIGQGEIIDCDSKPNPPQHSYRPQVDVIIYRRDVPKITYSQSDSAYLAEGVMATIESKSVLTEIDLQKACKAAQVHKSLKRATFTGFASGNIPKKIITYMVAFDGPAKLSTVSGWLVNHVKQTNDLPNDLVDLIVVLGKGALWRLEAFPELKIPQATANNFWGYVDQPKGNLLTLFAHMLTWTGASSSPPNTLGYVSKVKFANVQIT
jgi:hypothetical protein